MYCRGSWHTYHGGQRHPLDTATGDEGRCNHCGQRSSLLHVPPYEPCTRCRWRPGDPAPVRTDPSKLNNPGVLDRAYWESQPNEEEI